MADFEIGGERFAVRDAQVRYVKTSPWYRFTASRFIEVEDALQELLEDLSDLKPFYRDHFIPAYLRDMQKQFQTEGGYVGGWQQLSPEYEDWKERNYPGKLILERTGKLRRAFSVGGRSKYLSVGYTPRSATINITLEYAAWVNRDRPVLIPPKALDKAKYKDLLERYLQKLIKKTKTRKFSTAETGTGGSKSFLGF